MAQAQDSTDGRHTRDLAPEETNWPAADQAMDADGDAVRMLADAVRMLGEYEACSSIDLPELYYFLPVARALLARHKGYTK